MSASDPLRVLIADDEEVARKRLARLLGAIPGVEPCGECHDGEGVLRAVRAGGIDVILLDIQMPGLSGLDAMALLPDESPYVIFCTAHAEHAVQAFDAGAVDYLLKPVEPARLQKALERARARDPVRRFREELQRHKAQRAAAPELRRLAVPTRGGIVLVDPKDISHAVLDGELVTIHAAQGALITDLSLQELQARLPAGAFERVHRRALLNLEQVARLEPNDVGGYTARTHRGELVEVSRAAARELRKRLGLRRQAGDDEE
ncbi:MAG TPA: response regulator [Myxococcales bacterium]|nr:response regulator [Myxococcales bacterium]